VPASELISVSDKYGRKRVLLATMVGNIISAAMWLRSTTFVSTPPTSLTSEHIPSLPTCGRTIRGQCPNQHSNHLGCHYSSYEIKITRFDRHRLFSLLYHRVSQYISELMEVPLSEHTLLLAPYPMLHLILGTSLLFQPLSLLVSWSLKRYTWL
jgi:hypothetical protein